MKINGAVVKALECQFQSFIQKNGLTEDEFIENVVCGESPDGAKEFKYKDEMIARVERDREPNMIKVTICL